MRHALPPLALTVVALGGGPLAGCGPGASDGSVESVAAAPAAAPDSVSEPAADSVRLRLELPARVRAGETVPIALRVENVAARPVELYLRGRTVAWDVVVARADGAVAWRRLEGEVIPAIVQLRALAPGEVLTLRGEWDQRTAGGARVGPGRYVARGLLLTDRPEAMETPAVPLEVVPTPR